MRVRSTQKLPMVLAECRAMPRTSAAGDGDADGGGEKLWMASATICERYDIVDSPP